MSNTENISKEDEINGDSETSPLTYEQKIKWQEKKWKNRRRMAWVSMANLTAIIILYFFAPISETRLQIIADPLAMITFGLVGVVASYMGFTSYEKGKLGK